MDNSDAHLLGLIKIGNKQAFDTVFLKYFNVLHRYVISIINEKDDAEEIVQNVFYRIWTKRSQLKDEGFLKSFLYRSVRNESLNYIKHQKVRNKFGIHYGDNQNDSGNLTSEILVMELRREIYAAIDELPERCQAVFQLSRFEQMKYSEIAKELNISVKTVENHMGKALKILRVKMAEFLVLFFLLIK